MTVKKIDNLLSKKEINVLNSITDNLVPPTNSDGSFIFEDGLDLSVSKDLGRIQLNIRGIDNLFPYNRDPKAPESLPNKLSRIAKDIVGYDLKIASTTYVEYNSKYGKPDLPPHFDGDYNDLIINYQFKSNTRWDLGINFETYTLDDNSALAFNPNENAHWRPNKTFKDGEFVKMIFFRFENADKRSDYSELQKFWPRDEVFENIRKFRDSLVVD
jgi:hypothetical protein